MINAQAADSTNALEARLIRRAEALGKAEAESQQRQTSDAPSRWRDARLLWPLFTKD